MRDKAKKIVGLDPYYLEFLFANLMIVEKFQNAVCSSCQRDKAKRPNCVSIVRDSPDENIVTCRNWIKDEN